MMIERYITIVIFIGILFASVSFNFELEVPKKVSGSVDVEGISDFNATLLSVIAILGIIGIAILIIVIIRDRVRTRTQN